MRANPDDLQKAVRQIKASVTEDPEQLDAIAFGAAAVVANGGADRALQETAKRIIHDIKDREDARPPKVTDQYLANILKFLAVYERTPDQLTAPTTKPAKPAP